MDILGISSPSNAKIRTFGQIEKENETFICLRPARLCEGQLEALYQAATVMLNHWGTVAEFFDYRRGFCILATEVSRKPVRGPASSPRSVQPATAGSVPRGLPRRSI